MYDIIFYKNKAGVSGVEEFLNELSERAKTSKEDRVNHTKILSYLVALSTYGT